MKPWIALFALTLLLLSAEASADVTARFESRVIIEGDVKQSTPFTVAVRGEDGRLDGPLGTFWLDGDADALIHRRPDGLGTRFVLPVDLATAALPADRQEARGFVALFEGETTVHPTGKVKVIDGHEAELIEIQTVWPMGGRTDTELWLATEVSSGKSDVRTVVRLLTSYGRVHLGLWPWIRCLEDLPGRLPVLVRSVRVTDRRPPQVDTLRLVELDAAALSPQDLDVPAEMEIVPFRLDDYVQGPR